MLMTRTGTYILIGNNCTHQSPIIYLQEVPLLLLFLLGVVLQYGHRRHIVVIQDCQLPNREHSCHTGLPALWSCAHPLDLDQSPVIAPTKWWHRNIVVLQGCQSPNREHSCHTGLPVS
jgi:hypothetical protein